MGSTLIDLTGYPPFGRLTVLQRAANTKDGKARWECLCVCGTTTVVDGRELRRGHTESCGCLARELAAQRIGSLGRKHGLSTTHMYKIWMGMRMRCYNPNEPAFKDYGARGITVCERWLSSFETFYADMHPRPSAKHTIERLRNNEGYSPTNCIWALRSQQVRNRRNNVFLTHNGITQCLADWAGTIGIGRRTLHTRYRKLGWSAERTLTTPVLHRTF